MIAQFRSCLDRWALWLKDSNNGRIFAAIVIVGGFTIVVKLASTVKELVVAHQFGTGDALDAFLVAFVLPSFLMTVVAGSLNVALVPTYIQVWEDEGRDAAQRLFSSAMIWNTALLISISVLLALVMPYVLPVLASGFEPEKLALTLALFYLLLPVLLMSGLATTWRAILNAGERFALAAVAPIMTAVTTVLVLLVMGLWGIYALALGTVVGFALEAGLLAWGLKRQKMSPLPRWYPMEPAARRVIGQWLPAVAGAFLMSSTLLVDRSMATMLGSGSVSSFSYATKITDLMLGVGSLALTTAVLPYFSRMVAINDWSGIQATLKTYSGLILLTTIPLTLGVAYFSEPLIGALFQRGAFTGTDTHLVSQIQALYALQIPAYVLGMLAVRLVSSLKANHLVMWGAAISFLLNVSLNYLLMQWLGIAGIALSTTLVYYVSCGYLMLALLKLMKRELS
jgi:putative peptidoglycan lipid II flippase